jgi:hypothetical protein
MTATASATISLYVVCIGISLNALELLAARSEFARGLYSASIIGPVTSRTGTAFRIQQYPYSLGLPAAEVAFAACAIALSGARPLFVAMLLALHVARLRLFPLGLAGFDQMTTIVLVGVLLAVAFPGTSIAVAGLAFVAMQACLAYLTAGVAKAVSPAWRQGTAVTGILSTRAYGSRGISALVSRSQSLGFLLDWTTIGYEVLFPAAVIAGGWVLLAWLVAGLTFHVAIAVSMGLHMFIWTFGATYPAVLFFSWHILGRHL